AAMLSASLLTGCGTGSVGTVIDSSCSSFKPISMSKLDTTETKRQIVGHNRAFEAVCGAGGAPQKVALAP
ncbi:MAG: hypothetical protein ACK528_05440, partial [Alphaproteobacteria bacterium]